MCLSGHRRPESVDCDGMPVWTSLFYICALRGGGVGLWAGVGEQKAPSPLLLAVIVHRSCYGSNCSCKNLDSQIATHPQALLKQKNRRPRLPGWRPSLQRTERGKKKKARRSWNCHYLRAGWRECRFEAMADPLPLREHCRVLPEATEQRK